MKFIVVLFFSLPIFISCKEEKRLDPFENFFYSAETKELVGEEVQLNSDNLYFSHLFEMLWADNLLIVSDSDSGYNLKIIDLTTGQARRFCKQGKGPYEMKAPISTFSLDSKNRLLYVTDNVNYYRFSLDSLKGNVNIPLSYIEIKNNGGDFIHSTYANDGYVVGGSYENKVSTMNIRDFTTSQKYNYSQGPLVEQAFFYNHPWESKCVFFESKSAVMGLVEYENGKIRLNEKSWWKTEEIEVVSENIRKTAPPKSPKNGFITSAVTSKYIYTLYSGKILKGNNSEAFMDFFTSDMIYVFDWKGNPIKKYKLDRKVRSIAIDDKDEVLYAGSFESEDSNIIRYAL